MDEFPSAVDSRCLAEVLRPLADRVARGDEHAWTPLFDAVAPRVLRYSLALTRNPADAEDVLQATFSRLVQVPGRLASASHPWAYLLTIVRNESMRVIDGREHAGNQADNWVSLVAVGAAGQELEEAERRHAVQVALARLPQEQAEVVVLKIWESLTFQEIAEVVHESPNTVASRYRYALSKLGHTLRRLVEPSPTQSLVPAVLMTSEFFHE